MNKKLVVLSFLTLVLSGIFTGTAFSTIENKIKISTQYNINSQRAYGRNVSMKINDTVVNVTNLTGSYVELASDLNGQVISNASMMWFEPWGKQIICDAYNTPQYVIDNTDGSGTTLQFWCDSE